MYPTVLERVKICSVESISRQPHESGRVLRDYMPNILKIRYVIRKLLYWEFFIPMVVFRERVRIAGDFISPILLLRSYRPLKIV